MSADERAARAREFAELIAKLGAVDPGESYSGSVRYALGRAEHERDDLERAITTRLIAFCGKERARTIVDALLTGDVHPYAGDLRAAQADRLARKLTRLVRAVRHAEEQLEAIEERELRQAAEDEAAFQRRAEEARARGELREFGHRDDVRLLIEQHTGETYYDWGSAASLYGDALRRGLISDLEYDVAKRRYGRSWSYAGD
jgi:hypothetical protein